jgi:hypothetical protein
MNNIRLAIKSPKFQHFIIGIYLCVFLLFGFYTELKLLKIKPIPETLLEDFRYYEDALLRARNGQDPYSIRDIGPAFLYPPPALLVVEIFHHIHPSNLKIALYTVVNIALLSLITLGISTYYGYTIEKVWYWFILCMGFAPFLELLHIGQINIITLFGVAWAFYWEEKHPILSAMGWALAIVTKVTPLIFLGYLIVNKRYKTIISTLFIIAIATYASILRYGFSPILAYPNVFLGLLNQLPLGTNSQSLVAKLAIANEPWFKTILSNHLGFLQTPVKSIFFIFTQHPESVQRLLSIYILLTIVASSLFTIYGKQPKEPLFITTALGMMLSPNIMWYHHYAFILLPMMIAMGWSRLKIPVLIWCFIGFIVIQLDRHFPPYGLLIHIFSHLSLAAILLWQLQLFLSYRRTNLAQPTNPPLHNLSIPSP